MFCGKCGTQLSDTDKFCPRCGEKVIPVIVEKEKPSINQEEVQKTENPTSLEQSKPMKDSNETVRPTIVSLQNTSDKQDYANANTQNIEVPVLGSFDRQQFAIIVACLAAAIIIPLIFVNGLWSLIIISAATGFGVSFVLDKYKISSNNKVFYTILAVVALTGTIKKMNTNNDSSSAPEEKSSIFGIGKNSNEKELGWNYLRSQFRSPSTAKLYNYVPSDNEGCAGLAKDLNLEDVTIAAYDAEAMNGFGGMNHDTYLVYFHKGKPVYCSTMEEINGVYKMSDVRGHLQNECGCELRKK